MPSTVDAAPAEAPTKRESNLSKDERADLDTLNGTIDRMRALTAPDPYILTIPQDVEPRYHHSYQAQAMQWLHETPFRYHDGEKMQYQTFVYHEHGNGMYVLHSSRPADEAAEGEARTGKASMGASTPKDGAPKKKISLNAYKKAKTGANTPATGVEEKPEGVPAVKQPAVKGPVERIKAETEGVLAAAPEVEPARPDAERADLKRKREDSVDVREREPDKQDQRGVPVAKKPRSASPPPADKRPQVAPAQPVQRVETPEKANTPPASSSSPHEEQTGLPPKLSPLEVASLPARLSPTIPANIAATLKARERVRSSSDDNSTITSALKKDKLTPVRKAEGGITKHKSPIPRNAFRANSSSPAVGSDAEQKAVARPAVTSVPQPSLQRTKTPELTRDGISVVANALKKKKRELLVRLRYRKHQREAIKRILNLRPKPLKAEASLPKRITDEEAKPAEASSEKKVKSVSRDRKDARTKGVAQRIGPAPTSANSAPAKKQSPEEGEQRETVPEPKAEKRPPPSSQTHSAEVSGVKRKRAPEAIETSKSRGPSTPAPPDLQSPSLLSSAQKSQQVTPGTTAGLAKSHLLPAAVAMQRERSTETAFLVDSPSAVSINTSLTNGLQPPNTAHRSGPASSTSQPNNNNNNAASTRKPKHPAWEDRQKRLESLGRELKHAASAHLTAKEPKLAALKALESLLAYMLAFTCADESCLAAADPPKQTPDIRPWRSLFAFMGFVRHHTDPYPLLSGLASALGVVCNARVIDIGSLHPADGPSRDTLLDTFALLHRCAVDAETKLDVEVLRTQFPRTWKTKAENLLPLGVKLRDPAQSFAGPFKLPLGVQTSPLAAARAGHAMLREWVEREGVEYRLKLQL